MLIYLRGFVITKRLKRDHMEGKARLPNYLMGALLILSTLSFGVYSNRVEVECEEHIVMVELKSSEDLTTLGRKTEIIEVYDHHVLLRTNEDVVNRLMDRNFQVNMLTHRTRLYIGGEVFDHREGEPDIPKELRVDNYGSGENGQYIVQMLGPIARNWRPTLERMGVQVLNYIHNYAYRVQMTPELAERVSEMYFVDWVGIYHPYYKLQPGLEAGMVEIGLVPGTTQESFDAVSENAYIISFTELIGDGGYLLRAFVDSQEALHELARVIHVDYICRYVEPEFHCEMQPQIIGGGCWFFDDEDDNPETAYRKHGEYGSYMNQIGYKGEGIVIAIAGSGLGGGSNDSQHIDLQDRVIGGYPPDQWGGDFGDDTPMAGCAAGDTYHGTGSTVYNDYYSGQGSAPESLIYAVKIHGIGGEWWSDLYEVVQVAKQYADASVHSNSWGGGGSYNQHASSYDAASRGEDMVITVSVGNTGPDHTTIGSPALGKNVIAVGATGNYPNNPENVASFSSRGWTRDNRVKPDVVAPGVSISSLHGNDSYMSMSGTSISSPAVAGAAAVVIQWYDNNHDSHPSPAMVKALLINTASDLCNENGNTGPIPNRDEGWGIVDISKLERPLEDPVPFYLYDQEHIFTNSLQVHEHVVVPDRLGEPLKFSLVWTDKEAPGSTGDGRTLINDLNLEVETPSGQIIRGNAFDLSEDGQSDDGYTYPDAQVMSDFDYSGDGWDDTNNVQNVYIHPDDVEMGEYIVRVRAENIADDGTGVGYNSQDYALVAYNVIEGGTLDTFDISLFADPSAEGWNYVSFPIISRENNLESMLEHAEYGISGSYDRVMYYDASTGQWNSYVPGRPDHFNNLRTWDHTMGIWIRMTGNATLTVEGYTPTSTAITLYPGWNMVGLPSESAGNHDLPIEVTKIGYFDVTVQYNIAYTDDVAGFEFEPGKGYWVYNPTGANIVWTVEFTFG